MEASVRKDVMIELLPYSIDLLLLVGWQGVAAAVMFAALLEGLRREPTSGKALCVTTLLLALLLIS